MFNLHLHFEFSLGVLISAEFLVYFALKFANIEDKYRLFIRFMNYWIITSLILLVVGYFAQNMPNTHSDYHAFTVRQLGCLIVAIGVDICCAFISMLGVMIKAQEKIKSYTTKQYPSH